jgi:cytochrome c oxidase cbb3-type subunit 4
MGLLHGIWTLLLLLIFLGIVAWVWSAKRKKHFEQAGRIPLQDGDSASVGEPQNMEKQDGC